MLDINLIRQNPEKVRQGIKSKNINPKLVDDFLALDEIWRTLRKNIDDKKSEQNLLTKKRKIEESRKIKEQIKKLDKEIEEIEKKREKILYQIPNLPQEDVKIGKDEKENEVLREVGEKPKFDFTPKDYLTIAKKLDLIDIERAGKVSGNRFGYLKGQAALLELALIKLGFDNLIKEGFAPVIPPVIIKKEKMEGMGYVDRQEDKEETYFLEKDSLYLVATGEQSIGPMHSDEVLKEEELPKRYVAFSTCFRREAGSYGKDTKGIFRVHQFDKLEMFSFCKPEDSKKEHQFFLEMEEKLMQALKIPYRIVQMCSGDLGFPTSAKYDIEAWMPSENRYRETHSTSNCTDFQARRLNIRYRSKIQDARSKIGYVHMLNGTAFAIGRILIAIIENYQTKEGAIKVPEALQQYIGIDEIK